MRIRDPLIDFIGWRWSPCIGLTAGSLTFALLAVLFIPAHVGEPSSQDNTRSAFERSVGPAPRALLAASLTREATEDARSSAEEASPPVPTAPRPAHAGPPARRGFSPIVDRPEPPPAAPPPPPAAAPPAPAPPPPALPAVPPPIPVVEAAPSVPAKAGDARAAQQPESLGSQTTP